MNARKTSKTNYPYYYICGIIFGLLLVVLSLSCGTKSTNKTFNSCKIVDTINYNTNLRDTYVYEIRGHQYIGCLEEGQYNFLSHSGECKNPIHFKNLGTTIINNKGDIISLPDTMYEKNNALVHLFFTGKLEMVGPY